MLNQILERKQLDINKIIDPFPEAATFLKELREQLENPKNLTDAVFMKGLKEEEKFDI